MFGLWCKSGAILEGPNKATADLSWFALPGWSFVTLVSEEAALFLLLVRALA